MIDPYQILGLDPLQATDESVRKAYMEAIRNHPPDRDPEMFERIRDAYNRIADENKRIHLNLFGFENSQSMIEWLPENNERPRAGTEKWIAMIEEESKRIAQTNPYESKTNE